MTLSPRSLAAVGVANEGGMLDLFLSCFGFFLGHVNVPKGTSEGLGHISSMGVLKQEWTSSCFERGGFETGVDFGFFFQGNSASSTVVALGFI